MIVGPWWSGLAGPLPNGLNFWLINGGDPNHLLQVNPNIIEHPKQITHSNNAPDSSWSFKNRQKMYQSGLLDCSISSISILIATKHLQNKQLKISRNGNLATHFDRFIGLPQPFPIWRVGKPYHPVYGKLSIIFRSQKIHASWKSGTGTIIHVVGICVVPGGMEVDSMRWWHGCLGMVDHGWWRLVRWLNL